MSNILQEIFLDNYEEFMMTTHPRQAVIEMSIRWLSVVILLLAVPCTDVQNVALLNLFPSGVTADSALLAEHCILRNELLPCLLN